MIRARVRTGNLQTGLPSSPGNGTSWDSGMSGKSNRNKRETGRNKVKVRGRRGMFIANLMEKQQDPMCSQADGIYGTNETRSRAGKDGHTRGRKIARCNDKIQEEREWEGCVEEVRVCSDFSGRAKFRSPVYTLSGNSTFVEARRRFDRSEQRRTRRCSARRSALLVEN